MRPSAAPPRPLWRRSLRWLALLPRLWWLSWLADVAVLRFFLHATARYRAAALGALHMARELCDRGPGASPLLPYAPQVYEIAPSFLRAIAGIKHLPSLPAAPPRVTRLSSYPGGGRDLRPERRTDQAHS